MEQLSSVATSFSGTVADVPKEQKKLSESDSSIQTVKDRALSEAAPGQTKAIKASKEPSSTKNLNGIFQKAQPSKPKTIQEAKIQRDLRLLNQSLVKASNNFELSTFAETQNPVSRVRDEVFVPAAKLKSDDSYTPARVMKETLKSKVGAHYRKADKAVQQSILTLIQVVEYKQVKNAAGVLTDPSHQAYLGDVKSKLEKDIQSNEGKTDARSQACLQVCKELLAAVNNMDETINLENVPTRYSKEEVISDLAAKISYENAAIEVSIAQNKPVTDTGNLESLHASLKALKASDEQYLTKDQLQQMGITPSANLTEFISSKEAVAGNNFSDRVEKTILRNTEMAIKGIKVRSSGDTTETYNKGELLENIRKNDTLSVEDKARLLKDVAACKEHFLTAEQLTELKVPADLASPFKVPYKLKKSEVIDKINASLKQNRSAQLQEALAKVKAEQGEFVDAKMVEGLNIRCDTYVTYINADQANVFDPKFANQPGVAFKLGKENYRELLAQDVYKSLKIGCLTPKGQFSFDKATLQGLPATKGLYSQWLAEGKPIDHVNLKQYAEIKHQIAAKTARGEDVAKENKELETLRAVLQKPPQPSLNSLQELILADLVLVSYDSHGKQFMVVNGEAECVDFGRFLAPSSCFTREVGGQQQTFFTMRSSLFDHPAADEPLNAALKEKVLGWDADAIEQDLRDKGRLKSEEYFATNSEKLRDLKGDLAQLRAASHDLAALAQKHEVALSGNSEQDLQALKKVVEDKCEALQVDAFQYIHPNALTEMKQRMTTMQEYVKSTDNPTLRGMFAATMPEVDVIMRLAERVQPALGKSLAYQVENGITTKVSLETTIAKVKADSSVTTEEKAQLDEALTKLRQNALNDRDLSLTMAM